MKHCSHQLSCWSLWITLLRFYIQASIHSFFCIFDLSQTWTEKCCTNLTTKNCDCRSLFWLGRLHINFTLYISTLVHNNLFVYYPRIWVFLIHILKPKTYHKLPRQNWKRYRGRPKWSWWEGVHGEFRLMKKENWKETFNNRKKWRKVVEGIYGIYED